MATNKPLSFKNHGSNASVMEPFEKTLFESSMVNEVDHFFAERPQAENQHQIDENLVHILPLDNTDASFKAKMESTLFLEKIVLGLFSLLAAKGAMVEGFE